MTRGLFEGIPLVVVLLATAVALLIAAGAGYRLGARARTRNRGSTADMGTIMGGLLGLLGLMLAFTFGMAGQRFDHRRELVVEEANAIGTAWLRTDLIPEPMRGRARETLRAYVHVRFEAASSGSVEAFLAGASALSEQLQGVLWGIAAEAASASPTPTTALFVTAVNEVIDMHGRRFAAAVRSPIPPIIFGTLYAVSFLVLLALGFMRGLTGDGSALATSLLSVVLAVVLALILDLDRPFEGYLKVGQGAMRDLRTMMDAAR